MHLVGGKNKVLLNSDLTTTKKKRPEICRHNKIYFNSMHYGSYKGTHMKLKDNNFCPYNVTLSEMSENSSVTKKQKQTKKKN